MANIINFQNYVNSNEEEKRRIKKMLVLSTMNKNIEGLLYNIKDSVGCSFVTKHVGEMNQIIGKENMLDSNMIDVIVESLSAYRNTVCKQIDELNICSITTVTTC